MPDKPEEVSTTISDRDEAITRYYTNVDEYDTESLRDIFAADITFEGMGATASGRDDVVSWYDQNMTLAELYHDVEQTHHAVGVSYASGEFGGKLPNGEQMRGSFLNTFEFEEATNRITDLSVYTTLQPEF